MNNITVLDFNLTPFIRRSVRFDQIHNQKPIFLDEIEINSEELNYHFDIKFYVEYYKAQNGSKTFQNIELLLIFFAKYLSRLAAPYVNQYNQLGNKHQTDYIKKKRQVF